MSTTSTTTPIPGVPVPVPPTTVGDQPANPNPSSSSSNPSPSPTFPLGSCWSLPLRRPADLADPWQSSPAWTSALSPAHRSTIDSAILQSPQQLAFRGCIVFPFGTLTGGLDVLFLCSDGSTHLLSTLAAQLPPSSAGNPVSSCNPGCVGPADERKLRSLPASGLRINDRIAATSADPRLGSLIGCFSDDPNTCSTLNRPDSSIVGPLTCSSRRPSTMSAADPSTTAPQVPPPDPSQSPSPMLSDTDHTLAIVLASLVGVTAFALAAWLCFRCRQTRQRGDKSECYSDHEVLVSPRFVSPAVPTVSLSPYTTGAGSMTAVVIDSSANAKAGGAGGAKLLTSDTADDITVVIRDTPMSGTTALDHSTEHIGVRPGTPAAAAWGVCISPAPSHVASLLSPCSDRSADSLLALPPLHLHEKHHHPHSHQHHEALDVDRPVRSPTTTAGSLLRRSLSIGRREKHSVLTRQTSTRRSKSNDSSSPPSQMDLAGCSVTLSSFGLRPCPPAARRPTSGRRGHTKHDDPFSASDLATPSSPHTLLSDSTALLVDWFSMFQDLNDVATAYVGSAGRQHRAVVLVRLSSLLRPFLDNVISDHLFQLSHGLTSASPSPVAPKPKYLHFLFQDVLNSSPSEDPIAMVVNTAIATFLRDLTHAFPALARSQVPRGTRYDTWSEFLWTQAMRWYRIKAQRPFAALVEPQPGSRVRDRLMVVVGRAEELDEELGCEPSPPRASELAGAAEFEKEHGDLESQEDESVVAWCVFPALVDLARSKAIAKARVYVGLESGVE